MKRLAIFALASAGIIGALAMLLGMIYATPADQRAIRVSALAAYVVQLLAFAGMSRVRGVHIVAAWGLGVLVRFATLVVFAVVVVKGTMLPLAPALISLVTFFFLTTLVEPVLLTR